MNLEPCPFCGHDAEIERYGNSRQSTIYTCTSCSCRLETGEEWNFGNRWNSRRCKPDTIDALIRIGVNIDGGGGSDHYYRLYASLLTNQQIAAILNGEPFGSVEFSTLQELYEFGLLNPGDPPTENWRGMALRKFLLLDPDYSKIIDNT